MEQLIVQTGEFQHQTNLMIDQNQILKAQLELQSKAVINTEKFQLEAQVLEQQIRRTAVKPDFVIRQTGISQGYYTLQIANLGPIASNLNALSIQPDNLIITTERTEVRTNSANTLNISYFPNLNFNQISFKIRISYTDQDDNNYRQDIAAVSGNATIGKPYLAESSTMG
ncbi:MAG: hypothetical protein JWP45_636 [Mucilaginibacter sp.]|nr:hypothetical protein [Mucilaginibacter sp.]